LKKDAFYVSNNGELVDKPYKNVILAVAAAQKLVDNGTTKCAWVEKVKDGNLSAWLSEEDRFAY